MVRLLPPTVILLIPALLQGIAGAWVQGSLPVLAPHVGFLFVSSLSSAGSDFSLVAVGFGSRGRPEEGSSTCPRGLVEEPFSLHKLLAVSAWGGHILGASPSWH